MIEIKPTTHAKMFPASGTDYYMACNAWRSSSTSSKFAAEGTLAHEIAALCFVLDREASSFIGDVFTTSNYSFAVDADMAGFVQQYVDVVRYLSEGATLLVEQRLPIHAVTGEADAHGTADAVILKDDELTVVDLKYGMGVRVDAQNNGQLRMYALGALMAFEHICEPKQVRMIIHQPRLGHMSEATMTPAQLRSFAQDVSQTCDNIRAGELRIEAGESQCRWCANAPTCTTLANRVLTSIADDFVNLDAPIAPQLTHAEERVKNADGDHVAECFKAIGLIKDWIKTVEIEANRRLLAGEPVRGFKLVEGKRGHRKWINPVDAELAFKAMRVKTEEMYDLSLVSPTTAEKLVKSGALGPRQWKKLSALITQSEGQPSVAPESDKRPAIVVDKTGGFDSLPEVQTNPL
jgi:hypothetical protein